MKLFTKKAAVVCFSSLFLLAGCSKSSAEIEVDELYSIQGRVVSQNSNLDSVLVSVGDKSCLSDNYGRYQLNGINKKAGVIIIFSRNGYFTSQKYLTAIEKDHSYNLTTAMSQLKFAEQNSAAAFTIYDQNLELNFPSALTDYAGMIKINHSSSFYFEQNFAGLFPVSDFSSDSCGKHIAFAPLIYLRNELLNGSGSALNVDAGKSIEVKAAISLAANPALRLFYISEGQFVLDTTQVSYSNLQLKTRLTKSGQWLIGEIQSASQFATMRGCVKNSAGLIQPGAVVEISSQKSNGVKYFSSGITDASGNFSLPGIKNSQLTVKATYQNMQQILCMNVQSGDQTDLGTITIKQLYKITTPENNSIKPLNEELIIGCGDKNRTAFDSVKFYIDGMLKHKEIDSGSGCWSYYVWAASEQTGGYHYLVVEATDKNGFFARDSVRVQLINSKYGVAK